MTLRMIRGDESEEEEELERLGLKREGEIIDFITHPFIPFLLTSAMSNGCESYFVIEGCEKATIDIDKNNEVTQTFTWVGHKASEEEIEKFLSEEEE